MRRISCWIWTLTLMTLGGLVACVGEAPPQVGSNLQEPDLGVLAPPAAEPDGQLLDDGGEPDDDLGPSADTLGPPQTETPPKDCSTWSSWTCEALPVMVCKATCAAPDQTYSLSCLKKGGCVCEFSTGLCGPYSYADPCDACRKAFENGCCELF